MSRPELDGAEGASEGAIQAGHQTQVYSDLGTPPMVRPRTDQGFLTAARISTLAEPTYRHHVIVLPWRMIQTLARLRVPSRVVVRAEGF